MRYVICKFESYYGLPFYRVQMRQWLWRSWLTDEKGVILNFESKREAQCHIDKEALSGADRDKSL